jgi:hypothetical protein
MGQIFLDQTPTWAGGLFTSSEPDRIPENSFPYAKNNALFSLADGQAIPGKRPGMGQIHTTTPITGQPQTTGQTEFLRVDAGSVTKQHIVTTATGLFCVINTGGTLDAEISGWTPSVSYPDFESANNRLFVVDGSTAKKWTGSALQSFGIVRPADINWTTPTDFPTTGRMPPNSEYEIAITYYNSTSGHESSRSDGKLVTTADDGNSTHFINISLGAPPDTQVDKIRIYIRKTGLSTTFTQVAEIDSTPSTYNIDVTDEEINNQIIAAPGMHSNDPPPSGGRYLALHEGRLFVSDGNDIYYSQINKPEAFTGDAISGISRDGQKVTGLFAVGGQLLIFKQDSVWAVYGSDPQTWQVRLLIQDIGCVSHRSIVSAEGILFWWSEQGPVAWSSDLPDQVGQKFIAPTIHPSEINSTSYNLICAAVDLTEQKVHFAYPSSSSTRADLILTFNYRVGRFEGVSDPMDVASLTTASDSSDRPWVFLGNYNGQIFKCGRGSLDGLPESTPHTGTFVATATTQTSITLSGLTPTGSLPTTLGSLIERKITVVDSLGRPVSIYRARITANTADTLTVTPAIGQLSVDSTYTVYIASPDWQLDTRWYESDVPFVKKRYEWLYLGLRVSSSDVAAQIDPYVDFSRTRSFVRALYGTGTSTDVSWDPATWDPATWSASAPVTPRRIRLGLSGQSIKARFRNHVPNQAISILHLGIRGEFLRDKR